MESTGQGHRDIDYRILESTGQEHRDIDDRILERDGSGKVEKRGILTGD